MRLDEALWTRPSRVSFAGASWDLDAVEERAGDVFVLEVSRLVRVGPDDLPLDDAPWRRDPAWIEARRIRHPNGAILVVRAAFDGGLDVRCEQGEITIPPPDLRPKG